MRITAPQLALAAGSVVLVTFLVVVDLQRTSPGPLSTAHARVAELAEEDCGRCHGEAERTLADACNACHEPLAAQLASNSGFHGTLEQPTDCGHCHVEHFGTELPLVSERTFALAGFEPRASYTHAGLGFELTGRHVALDCEQCHVNADRETLDSGERRFIGQTQECAACHEDPHEGRMVESCQSCHGQSKPFADVDGFVHSIEFPLSGVHSALQCDTCHEPESAYAVGKLGGHDAPAARNCADCHESPHTASFVVQVAQAVNVQPSASCVECHALEEAGQDFARFDSQATIRLHGASGFELTAPHDQTDCANCHEAGYAAQRRADDCVACHESPHAAQFDAGPFASFACLDCHARAAFAPATFDAQAHAQTEFPLTQGHASANCADCHAVPVESGLARADFTAVERQCAGCHTDAHDGLLLSSNPQAPPPSACDTCHTTSTFQDGAGDGFEHDVWTGFELAGAHLGAQCEACHHRSPAADALGRRFGRIAEVFGSPAEECATCHTNVHVGPMANSSNDCAQCHGSTTFADVAESDFDHARHTGFELVGAHARAECAVCHAPRLEPDANGRSFGLVTETHAGNVEHCAGCHDNPHGRRFRELRSTEHPKSRLGCARCHDQESFRGGARDRFEHERWTEFALEDGHAEVDCDACHVIPASGALGIVPGTSCAACHEDSHAGQFGTGDASRCNRCHQSTQAFTELVFDHARDASFALDEQHAPLDCDACHQPWPLQDGGQTIRYKPLGSECADCHLGEDKR